MRDYSFFFWPFDRKNVGWDAIGMKCWLFCGFVILWVVGCAVPPVGPTHVSAVGVDVRTDLTIIEPTTDNRINWSDVLLQIRDADVVLLGEQHDHAVGHAVQLAIVEDVMDTYPGSVLALEMLERDEQILVDDFMEDFIDAETLEKLSFSTNWGGRGGWVAWYQPIIEATKDRGGEVVAANAPRRYVRLARTGGYERIDELADIRRQHIDYPEELSGGRYRQRFWELAAHSGAEDKENVEEVDVTVLDPDDPMLPVFRSQQAWDATMAQSIVNAEPNKLKKVVLLVGQFHVEYDGGIVQELRQRNPSLNVFVISIQREIPDEEWMGKPVIADIMVVDN